MTGPLSWYWLGRVGYRQGTRAQEALRQRLLAGEESAAALLLLEHHPVVTLGRHASRDNLVAPPGYFASRGVEVAESSRGGDVTYHGPGQLMVYPVVCLTRGVTGYLESLAAALAEVAARFGAGGSKWQREPPGLWLDDAKLAACGLHVHRNVAVHGFALNVATPPSAWEGIVPCGLTTRVTSIAEAAARRSLPPPPSVAAVALVAAPIICAALGRTPAKKVCPFSGDEDTISRPG